MLNITFIGDIFPGDELFTVGYGIKSKTNHNIIRFWQSQFQNVLGKADFIIGNLESPLLDDKYALSPTFYGLPEFAGLLAKSGINVINVANNHILEHGIKGFNSTLNILERNNISTFGCIQGEESKILCLEAKGSKICIAGFCDDKISSLENPNCYASLKEDILFATLEKAKLLKPDTIIMVFHWGNEYETEPNEEQRTLAQFMCDCGVDVIVGTHPHVIQPWEELASSEGHKTIVYYSLGNFISGQNIEGTDIGGIARFSIGYTMDGVGITAHSFEEKQLKY